MTTIQIEDATAEGLAAMAHTHGVTVQVLLASLVQRRQPFSTPGKVIDFDTETRTTFVSRPEFAGRFFAS